MSRNALLMIYIMAVWFAISFVTNLIGPLMPVVISDFHLSLGMAGFLPFSFFLAYGLISIPAGAVVEARGPRFTLLVAFAFNLAGCLAISLSPTYLIVIAGLFVIGLGMAMLQVVINPLMRTTGGEQHFAFFSVMAQLVFGAASFVSPLVFAAVMKQPATPVRPIVWVELYYGFVASYVLLLLITSRIPIPQVTLAEVERPGTLAMYRSLIRERPVQLFFFGIIAYVGTEQSLADWMSVFLETYHHFSPTVEGAHAVSLFWGLMSVGCLVGLVLLRLIDSKRVLGCAAVLAIGCVALALFGSADVSFGAFAAAGFFLSVMWSIVFSLALNSVSRYHGAFSGILCTGITGGAIVPSLVGQLADHVGLRSAMLTVFVTLGYILSVSFWARPLIRNETVRVSELFNVRKSSSQAGPG